MYLVGAVAQEVLASAVVAPADQSNVSVVLCWGTLFCSCYLFPPRISLSCGYSRYTVAFVNMYAGIKYMHVERERER
jgi:hypothetical protein